MSKGARADDAAVINLGGKGKIVGVLLVFLGLAALAALYWVVALVAPKKRDGVPGINLPEVSATPETWKAAHSAISSRMTILAVYSTVVTCAIPFAMLAGWDVDQWWFIGSIAVGLIWFSAQIPRALRAARAVAA